MTTIAISEPDEGDRVWSRPAQPIRRHRAMVLALVAGCLFGGCQRFMPNVAHPGNSRTQQQRAALFDPFPDPDLGPDVVGGRPREFQAPYHEAVKSRAYNDLYQPSGF